MGKPSSVSCDANRSAYVAWVFVWVVECSSDSRGEGLCSYDDRLLSGDCSYNRSGIYFFRNKYKKSRKNIRTYFLNENAAIAG